MFDFNNRSTLPELMDETGVSKHEIHLALEELENVNTLLGGYSVILDALNKINFPEKEIVILDLGCGGGDMLRAVAKWAIKSNKKVKLIGVDRNIEMTEFAKSKSANYSNIQFITFDVFDNELNKYFPDIVMSSLFCHHFDDLELSRLVKKMFDLANFAIIINDLHRNWFAYYSIKYITSFVSKSYLVKYDAPLSVARSLTKEEWKTILDKNEILNYKILWKWAWRWQIIGFK